MKNLPFIIHHLPGKMVAIMSRLVFFFVMFLFYNMAFGQQPPTNQKGSGKANFYEIQKEFNDYWKDRPVTRGQGYKVFRRWEWFWEQRVGRSGIFPPNNVVVSEWEKYAAAHASDLAMDGEGNWTSMGPGTTTSGYAGLGRVNCIAFHPTDPNTFWVGTPSGGLWKTTDFGNNWICLTDKQPVIGVSDIAIDPNNPQIIYIATGDGDGGSYSSVNGTESGDTKSIGILKSVNGGTTWDTTALNWNAGSNFLIRRLIMHPSNSAILLAATSNGIYMTTNGGTNFQRMEEGYFIDIAYKPGDPLIMYASTRGNGSTTFGQIYRSVNGGLSWDKRTSYDNVIRIKLTVTPQNPQLVEALCTSVSRGLQCLTRSINSGDTFQTVFPIAPNCSNNMLHSEAVPAKDPQPCGGQGEYDLCYLINPTNSNERWLGGVNTWKSSDQGQTWVMKTYWTSTDSAKFAEVHADKHWFAFHPTQTNTFFEGNDGGIYYTTDGGKTWKDISNGLRIGQIYKIGNSYSNPKIVIGGFQDNGSQIHNDGSWVAPPAIGGDGMGCQIDYVDPNIKYASYCNGLIFRTKTADWKKVDSITYKIPGGQPAGAWVTPFILHPKDTATLYAGFKMNLYKATKRGDSWVKIFTIPSPVDTTDSLFRTIAISQSNPACMYAATGYKLFKTNNEWINSKTILMPDTSKNMITAIVVHPRKPDTIYITYSGYTAGSKVYRSYDGGNSWTNISGTLPNIPVNCIEYQDSANDALYIGTDVGVYFRNSLMTDWKYFSKGLPNVVIADLKIQYMKGKIRAATFGRGLWESDLYVAPGTYQVNAVDIPMIGGDVSGDGTFQPGAKARMNAKPEPGYRFDGWYENETLISDTSTYEFTVNENHNLVGMFVQSTGIEEKLTTRIHLFPNPTKGVVEIRMDKGLPEDIQKVTATNMAGRKVYDSYPQQRGDHFFIDLSDKSQGTYLLTFYFKSGSRVTYSVVVKK